MIVKQIAVLAVATLSALGAGGGVIALANARTAATASAAQAPTLTRAADGHFWADAVVEGANGRRALIHFLVDTGSSSVALTAEDARRLGIDLGALTYTRPVFTAEGKAQAAPVMLSRVTVAGAPVEGVKALVMGSNAHASLLGMSYLGRLSRIEATPTGMTLHR